MNDQQVRPHPTVSILMGTYNGGLYVRQQLESILAQSHKHWKLIVSDDGSSDDTPKILDEFRASRTLGQITIVEGPRQGFATNFLSLALNVEADSEYFAFSDQDDVWLPNKLERALNIMSRFPAHVPVAYGSRTALVDANCDPIGFSPMLRRAPTFKNALAQSIAGGNTIVFNRTALQLLHAIGMVEIVSHDWWLYLVVTAVGGHFVFDPEPTILYRQHGGNLVGTNTTLREQLLRAVAMIKGRYRRWMELNIAALASAAPFMTTENLDVLETLKRARNSMLINRLLLLSRSGVRRQTLLGNCGLAAACVLNRV